MLIQNYPDTIECPKCHTKWKNYSLSGGGSKGYYKVKHKAGRS